MSDSFDSSSLIKLKNNYPEDVFPTVWKNLDNALSGGHAIVSEEVIAELAVGSDNLDKRIKSVAGCVVKTDPKIEKHVQAILKTHPKLVDIKLQKSLGDPYVVAVAMNVNGGVVTEESDKPNRVKIPHVCQYYKTPCAKLLDYMRKQRWSF